MRRSSTRSRIWVALYSQVGVPYETDRPSIEASEASSHQFGFGCTLILPLEPQALWRPQCMKQLRVEWFSQTYTDLRWVKKGRSTLLSAADDGNTYEEEAPIHPAKSYEKL